MEIERSSDYTEGYSAGRNGRPYQNNRGYEFDRGYFAGEKMLWDHPDYQRGYRVARRGKFREENMSLEYNLGYQQGITATEYMQNDNQR